MDNKEESIHEIFVPGFTPPPISKDWERSYYTPTMPPNHFLPKESAKLLNAQHFFVHEDIPLDEEEDNA